MNLDALQTFDKSILLAFNGGENIFLDSFVLTLTSAYTWIPLYASLLYLVIKNNENWQKIMLIIGTVALGLFIVNGTNLGFSLLVRDRIFSILMIVWSIIVSLTRPYLGVHYPSDVLVGMIFGSSVAVLIYFLYLRMYIRFSDKLHYISTKYTRTGYSFADIDVVICVLILSFIYAAFRAVLSI